jgi:signal transduction histidine kinase/CheY-like chemotaxis protein
MAPNAQPADRKPAASAAFSIGVARNLLVQTLGVAMVVVMGLSAGVPVLTMVWTAVAVAVLAAEHLLLRLIVAGGRYSRSAELWAPVLRILATCVYALAALVLIGKGGSGAKLFAFALMTTSMVHVLMRFYRSPRVLVACLAPYILVLALIGVGLTQQALRQHAGLAAFAGAFTIAIIAIQFWSARAQLAGAWNELLAAREQAEARAVAADAANRAKSQFLANMSHELRTPLNGVLGMAQALSNDGLTQVQRERVRIIRRSSESLLAVLNDLVDLSKIEASAVDLEVVEFDLEHLVKGVAATYQPLAEAKGLAFAVDLSTGASGRYRGDSVRIRRILHNLVANAVKFTDAGEVAVSVGTHDGGLRFEVRDTGIGISEADQRHLFEGFFQVDGSLSRRHQGAGLGLAICAELARVMGGGVSVRSRLGEGSVFGLDLPVERAVSEPAEASQPPQPATELRVLAAEDNAVNQLVLKTLLGPAGIEPTLVGNGREAVDAWERERWDIVLMDIQMPEMDGLAAARAIRRRELETGRPRTPIVAVTANAMPDQIDQYRAVGMDGVVAKPFDVADLFAAMQTALADDAGAGATAAG